MNGQYRKNTIIPAFLALFQKLWGTNLFVLLCAYTILLWIMMHPFSPFRSPNFAHHFPAHPLENTVSHSFFTFFNVPAPVSSGRPIRPVQKICAAFLRAFPAFILLKTRTCRLWSAPRTTAREHRLTLFFYAFQCSGVRLAHPINCASIRPLVFRSFFFTFSFVSVFEVISYRSDSRLAHRI